MFEAKWMFVLIISKHPQPTYEQLKPNKKPRAAVVADVEA